MRESEYNNILWMNRFIIYTSNFISSLEVPFRRYALDHSIKSEKLSYYVALVRFYWILCILLRILTALLLSSCKFGSIRYYIYDWTTFYPLDSRSDLSRCFIAVCTIQLTLKRSIFFKRTLDSSLIDHLCNLPRDNCAPVVKKIENKNIQAFEQEKLIDRRRLKIDYQGYSRYLNRLNSTTDPLDEIDVDVLAAKLKLYSVSTLVESSLEHDKFDLETSLRNQEYNNYNRDQVHWIYVSRRLRRAYWRAAISIMAVTVAICLSACFRIGFRLDVARDCDLKPPLLRSVAVLEVFYCLFEFGITILGATSNIVIVNLDLKYQSVNVMRELQDIVRELECFGQQVRNKVNSDSRKALLSASNTETAFESAIAISHEYTPHEWSNHSMPQDLRIDLKEKDNNRLEAVQHKVIGFLTSMDSQKPLVSLIGQAQLVWLAATFSFVPLIVRIFMHGTLATNPFPFLNYITIVSQSVVFTVLLTTAGAGINQRVSSSMDA